MEEAYLILCTKGFSFGKYALVEKEIFEAWERKKLNKLDEKKLSSLNDNYSISKHEDIINYLKNKLINSQDFFLHLNELNQNKKLPDGIKIFPSPTDMVIYVKKYDIEVIGDTFEE